MRNALSSAVRVLAAVVCLQLCAATALGNAATGSTEEAGKGRLTMQTEDRAAAAARKYEALFGEARPAVAAEDAELVEIMNRLVYGEIYQQGKLSDRQRELISLAALMTVGDSELLRLHAGAALEAGASAVELKETAHQCAPYIGFPKALAGLREICGALRARGVSLPVESQARVTEADRLEKGVAVQKQLFGDAIDAMRANAPQNQKHIQDYLSAFCFGDTYTRGGLDLKTRELLTYAAIAALGGCESQLKAHIGANAGVGNDKETLIAATVQCLPYIGFPRTLNALRCLNEALPEA